MSKRKEIIIIGVLIVLLLILIVGVSYAAFSYSGLGSKVNTITTGAISMTYEETDNVISLDKALPTTDKTGKKLEDYFEFTVSGNITGDTNINYEIAAKDVTTAERKIDGSNIKLYLTRVTEDGDEEEVMAPKIYNEEASANEYTGRPSEEMSLYTGSMSSSESNTYRLRMYVTEEYNPQGDGGDLQFSVKINVYGKDGEKYVPLTTREILEDNPLQIEKENMFNYTADGIIIDNYDDWNMITNQEYITNGLYSMEDEDGTSYYFRGSNVNNYVQFGTYTDDYYVYRYGSNDFVTLESCQYDDSSCNESNKVLKYSAGTPMYWRIVRVNGDGSLRLIYNGTSTNAILEDLGIAGGFYNFDKSDPKYTGYTYDRNTNELDSNVKTDIDIWYSVAVAGSLYDDKVIDGRFCSDSSGYKLTSEYGLAGLKLDFYVYSSSDRLEQWASNWTKADMPTLICPKTDKTYGGSYRLKVGLITKDEVILAGETTHTGGDSYLSSTLTMSPNRFYSDSAYISTSKGYGYVNYYYDIRPVINVKVDNGFASGDGTTGNPYVLS